MKVTRAAADEAPYVVEVDYTGDARIEVTSDLGLIHLTQEGAIKLAAGLMGVVGGTYDAWGTNEDGSELGFFNLPGGAEADRPTTAYEIWRQANPEAVEAMKAEVEEDG